MHNTGEDPIRRAAGIMLWKMERGAAPSEALAEAWAHEPQLSDAQIRYAMGWAAAAQRFRDMAGSCESGCSLGTLLDRSGLRPFLDRENQPV